MSWKRSVRRRNALVEVYATLGTHGEAKDAVNAYDCDNCSHAMVTINVDRGTTPFIVRCQQCGGEARSRFYRETVGLKPEFEWYRPALTDALRLRKAEQAHVMKGGLLLRRRKTQA